MMDHNDFPKMTDAFDRRVRETLDSLPDQPQRVRRFPFKRADSKTCPPPPGGHGWRDTAFSMPPGVPPPSVRLL